VQTGSGNAYRGAEGVLFIGVKIRHIAYVLGRKNTGFAPAGG
jgi:hypothetical protein